VISGKRKLLLEARRPGTEVSPPLRYFSGKYDLREVPLGRHLKREFNEAGILIRKGRNFFSELL
jgi:hypothetical protein